MVSSAPTVYRIARDKVTSTVTKALCPFVLWKCYEDFRSLKINLIIALIYTVIILQNDFFIIYLHQSIGFFCELQQLPRRRLPGF